MKRFYSFLLLISVLLVSLICFGCSKSNNNPNTLKELVRFANGNGHDIVPVEDKYIVEEVKKIANSITYTDEDLKLESTREDDYSFWLENNKSNMRVFNIYIWLNDDHSKKEMIVLNDQTHKYGYIKSEQGAKLKNILDLYIKED